MFRDWIFYPLVALIAAGLIVVSFGGALFARPPAPQDGQNLNGALVFSPAMLARIEPGPAPTFSPRTAGQPTALRVATRAGAGDLTEATPSARLLLTPAAAQTFSGKPLAVEILVRPIPTSTAPELAVGLVAGGVVTWARQPLGPDPALLSFTFPSPTAPIEAIALYPVNPFPERTLGVEIGEIRVRAR